MHAGASCIPGFAGTVRSQSPTWPPDCERSGPLIQAGQEDAVAVPTVQGASRRPLPATGPITELCRVIDVGHRCRRTACLRSALLGASRSSNRLGCRWHVPQRWLAWTTAPGVLSDDRSRLDFVVCGASRLGEALCCNVTLVSATDGAPQLDAANKNGTALRVARWSKEAAYPELLRLGPQRLVVLAA